MSAATKKVVLITCADLHLSHTPPVFRSKEPDWYAAMARPLAQLKKAADKYDCPVVYAGDLFDDGWRPHKCPPELINFAAKHLPKGYAIPGQHDLPHHRYEDMEKSAYWTLCQMQVIEDLSPAVPITINKTGIDLNIDIDKQLVYLYGFPWGIDIEPRVNDRGYLHVAVVHACCWITGHGYNGAPEYGKSSQWKNRLRTYDVGVFGDNHNPFFYSRPTKELGPSILNNGTLMVRRADEVNFVPKIGLVYDDGSVDQFALDRKDDVYLEEYEMPESSEAFDSRRLIQELERDLEAGIDFAKTLRRKIDNPTVRTAVADLIATILEQET